MLAGVDEEPPERNADLLRHSLVVLDRPRELNDDVRAKFDEE